MSDGTTRIFDEPIPAYDVGYDKDPGDWYMGECWVLGMHVRPPMEEVGTCEAFVQLLVSYHPEPMQYLDWRRPDDLYPTKGEAEAAVERLREILPDGRPSAADAA